MVLGRHKSRTFKRIHKTTPGGRKVIHYERRKHARAQCGTCGKDLASVPTGPASKMRNMPKTAKRPERPFGGVLCSPCSRKALVERAKSVLTTE